MYSLAYQDFWPACLLAEEGFKNAQFERFDVLLPQANSWLRQNPRAEVTKCQTLEKRITSPEQLGQNNAMCVAPRDGECNVYYVKGLRIWYYFMSPSRTNRHHSMQIAYRNFLPRCVEQPPCDWPEFEDLTELYTSINEELDKRPVEGCVLTVETVPLRVSPDQLADLGSLQVDQSQWLDTASASLLYITRVYYCFQCPAYEQVGAADFFPDHQMEAPDPSLAFSAFSTIIAKVNCWLTKVKDIRITNIQTLETVYEPADQEDKLETSSNFLPPEPGAPLIRFVRVTYVRPKYGLPPGGLRAPRAVWYKNFVCPSALRPETNGGGNQMAALWERVQSWNTQHNRTVLDIELLHYPQGLLQKEGEDVETTVILNHATEPLAELLRVYYSCTDVKPMSSPTVSSSSSMSSGRRKHKADTKPNCAMA